MRQRGRSPPMFWQCTAWQTNTYRKITIATGINLRETLVFWALLRLVGGNFLVGHPLPVPCGHGKLDDNADRAERWRTDYWPRRLAGKSKMSDREGKENAWKSWIQVQCLMTYQNTWKCHVPWIWHWQCSRKLWVCESLSSPFCGWWKLLICWRGGRPRRSGYLQWGRRCPSAGSRS